MRPLRLDLQGFKSFYRPATIDFEALAEGGVFGIFGNTGAGKSTIVDALIYALYGETDDRALSAADYVNRRLPKAEITLTFALSEPDGSYRRYEAYRAIAVDRAKNTLKAAKAELFDVTEARISLAVGVRDVNQRIEELVGLNLREFSNCIVLEQNEYDKFVKSTNAERKAIVGSLFDLQRFGPGLKDRLSAKESELALALARVTERLGMLGISPEVLKEKEILLAGAERDFAAAQARESELGASVERGRAEAERFRRKAELAAKNADYSSRCEAAKVAAEALARRYEEISPRAEAEIKSASETIEDCARREAKLETVRDTDARIAAAAAGIEKTKKTCAVLTAETAEEESKENSLADKIRLLEENKLSGIGRFAALSGIELHAEPDRESETTQTVASYVRELDAKVRRYGDLCEETRALETELAAKRAEIAKGQTELGEIDGERKAKSGHRGTVAAALTAARAELDAARADFAAAALSEKLHAGDRCPVCGGTVTELPPRRAPELEEKGQALKRKEEELASADAELQKIAENQDTANRLLFAAKEIFIQKETALAAANVSRDALGLDDGCAERFNAAREIESKFNALFDKLRAARTERLLNGEKLGMARANLAREQAALAELEATLIRETATRAAVAGENSAETALAKVKAARADAERQLGEWRNALESARRDAERTASELRMADALYAASRKEEEEFGEVVFDAAAYGRAVEELEAVRREKERLTAVRAELASEYKRGKEDLEQKKATAKEKAELDRSAALYEKIRKMTRGGELMGWLAEEYIQDFTALASEKLYALTDGELELKYTPDGFVVTDNFNDCEERKVATVSGGETFLVSLSLAVAIAAKLEERAGARRVEFLFIDEGFGTLSQDKIDAVMDALSALGKERFTVGFISHVDQMRRRIERQLVVKREDADLGSVAEMI